jgi:hypothetical protein
MPDHFPARMSHLPMRITNERGSKEIAMSDVPESSGSSTKIVLIVVGVVGFVLLMMALACGGLIYWGISTAVPTLGAIQTSANGFVQDIRAGQFQAAYNRTTTGYQSRQSLQQFQKFVAIYPELTTHTSVTLNGYNITTTPAGGQSTVNFTAVTPNNSLAFTLILIEENGQWRVDSFTVP